MRPSGRQSAHPTSSFINTLKAARLAADASWTCPPSSSRTDALGATLLTSDIDPRDRAFLTGTHPGEYFCVKPGLETAIARSLAYAPYADLLWFETSKPDLAEARRFAEAIHAQHPGKLLAYNCSPSFNWKKHLDDATIAKFQDELGAMGYKFQFITLAGWHHQLPSSIWPAGTRGRHERLRRLQEAEFTPEEQLHRNQTPTVGTGYFDEDLMAVPQRAASTSPYLTPPKRNSSSGRVPRRPSTPQHKGSRMNKYNIWRSDFGQIWPPREGAKPEA